MHFINMGVKWNKLEIFFIASYILWQIHKLYYKMPIFVLRLGYYLFHWSLLHTIQIMYIPLLLITHLQRSVHRYSKTNVDDWYHRHRAITVVYVYCLFIWSIYLIVAYLLIQSTHSIWYKLYSIRYLIVGVWCSRHKNVPMICFLSLHSFRYMWYFCKL